MSEYQIILLQTLVKDLINILWFIVECVCLLLGIDESII